VLRALRGLNCLTNVICRTVFCKYERKFLNKVNTFKGKSRTADTAYNHIDCSQLKVLNDRPRKERLNAENAKVI